MVAVQVAAADQPASRGEDLAAVERDLDLLVLERLARGVERDEAQAQVVLLHQPAVGLHPELHRGRIDRHRAAGGEHLAIGVLIIHLDAHVGQAVERGHVDSGARGAAGAERDGERLGRRQRCRLVVALAVERLDALLDLRAAEAEAVIALGRGGAREPADAHVDRQMTRAAAGEIADVQVERQRLGPDRRGLRPRYGRPHRRQPVFVDLERLVGVGDVVAADDAQIIVAHRRALRRGPARLADAARVDGQRHVELRVRAAVREAQGASEALGNCEAAAVGPAHDVLHVDRLALTDERPVEDGVEDVRRRGIAVRQFEIGRADALAPAGQREAEIVAGARRHHQRVRRTGFAATAVGFGFRQPGGDHHAAAAIGRAAGDRLAGAAVADLDGGVGHGLAGVERGHPNEAALPPPFEMDRHVGDERGAGDVARRVAAEERAAEHRAGEFDDVEAGLAERNADDLEVAPLAGQAELQPRALAAEDRAAAGMIDPAHDRVTALHFLDILLVGGIDGAQPFGNRAVGIGDLERATADVEVLALQRRLDIAHGHRQHPALRRLEDAEAGGELDQRWRGVEAHVQREALGIGQRAAALVLEGGGQRQLRRAVIGQRRLEGDVGDRRLLLVVVVEGRCDLLAVGERQPDLGRLAHRHRRGEADIGGLDRAASRLRIGAAAFEAGGERLAHAIVEALVGAGELARGGGDALRPDERDIAAGGQGAPAFQRGDAGIERLAFGRLGGDRFGQAGAFEEAAHRPGLRPHLADQAGGEIGGEHVDRDLLAQSVDGAIGIGGDRGARRCNRRRDEEDLILLDRVAIARRQDRERTGAAGLDGKAGTAAQHIAGHALDALGRREAARRLAAQRGGEIEHPGLRIDPAAGAGAGGGEGRGGAGIAERDHRLVEADRIAFDRAAVAAAAGLGEHDLWAVVAERRHRRERQRQHRPPHPPSPPVVITG